MARKNATISATVSDDFNVLSITVQGFDPIVIDVRNLADEIRARATLHGLGQKIGDAAALGKDATDNDKHAAMLAVAERLQSGEWNKRNGEGGGGVPVGIIFRAYSIWVADRAAKAKKPVPPSELLRASYDKLERKGQLALRSVPEIAAIIDRLKAETVTKTATVDTDALLAEVLG